MVQLDNSPIEKSQHRAVAHAKSVFSTEDLGRLYWLSGSTCAGKTTISSKVAAALGWGVYHCDEWERAQGERANPEFHTNWFRYARMTGDELWLQPVREHLALQALSDAEQFEMVVDELAIWLARSDKPLIYDGFVAPRIVKELIPNRTHAFYLVASDEFQRDYYQQRPWIKDVLAKTTDPAKAWENWMVRDSSGARALEKSLDVTDLSWVMVDGSRTLQATVEHVLRHFSGRLAV